MANRGLPLLLLLTFLHQGHSQSTVRPFSTSLPQDEKSTLTTFGTPTTSFPGNSTGTTSTATTVVIPSKTTTVSNTGGTKPSSTPVATSTPSSQLPAWLNGLLQNPDPDTISNVLSALGLGGGNSTQPQQLPGWVTGLLANANPDAVRNLMSILGGGGANSSTSAQLPAWMTGLLQGLKPNTPNNLLNALGNGSNPTQPPLGNLAGLLQGANAADLGKLLSMLGLGSGSSGQILGLAGRVFSAIQGMFQAASNVSVSPQCSADIATFQADLLSFQLWALQMLDASGKPRAGLLKGQKTLVGDYGQCLDISHQSSPDHVIRGQFCRLKVQLDLSKSGAMAALGPILNPLIVHLCTPSSCNASDISTIFRPALDATGGLGTLAELPDCDLGLQDPSDDVVFWIAIGVISFLALLCAAGTLYGEILDRRKAADKYTISDVKIADENGHVNAGFDDATGKLDSAENGMTSVVTSNGSSSTKDASGVHIFDVVNGGNSGQLESKRREEGTCSRLLVSFSVLKNGRKLLSCRQNQGELSCLHGLRVLSITWVLLGHSFSMQGSAGPGVLGNAADMFKLFSRWSMSAIYAGTLSVDTFFLLSGCLTSYLFLRQTKKSGGITLFNMVMYYVHRFWRLTPLYMFTILIFSGIMPYISSGPFTFYTKEADVCRTYWWYNLLYINNLAGLDKLCIGWSWYLSDDMQFYWIAPLALVPLALGYRAVGVVVSCLLVLCQIVSVAVINHEEGLHTFLGDNVLFMEDVYFPPWCRVGPFAIGLVLGYVLHKHNSTFAMQKLSVILGWLMAVAVGLTCAYVTHDDVKDIATAAQGEWTVDQAGVFEAFSRPLWACAVAWVIFACCTGYGGFVNTILSWRAWAPLSRLTYGVYLFHLVIFYVLMYNQSEPFYLSTWNVTELFLALTVLSFMVSFVTSLLVESPTLGVEKVLLGGAARKKNN